MAILGGNLRTVYRVVSVSADSDHRLAKYVEDDEQLFVIWNDGWCMAEDFFSTTDIKKFAEV